MAFLVLIRSLESIRDSTDEFDHKFDEANREVFFSGAYFSDTAIENSNIDLCYLWLQDNIQVPARVDGHRHTIGTRYTKLFSQDGGRVWDMDVEGAYHFFDLASDGDRAYNVAGAPIGAPGNGTDLGQALDLYGF